MGLSGTQSAAFRALLVATSAIASRGAEPTPSLGLKSRLSDKVRSKTKLQLKVMVLWSVVAIQGVSAVVFVWELWTEVLGLRTFQISWFITEVIQLTASIGLVLGLLATSLFLRASLREMNKMQRHIDVACGNFQSHVEYYFDKWELSQSEAAVATYAMKGFSNAEIAELRGTSSSTIKTQMQAIFRKSNLANRQQLISFLVGELMSGVAVEPCLIPKSIVRP